MNRNFFILLFVIIGFIACKNKEGKDNAQTTENQASAKHILPADFYKRYEGTIAGKPVVMHISKYGNDINANYYYTEHGENIMLYQNKDTLLKNDSIALFEISRYKDVDGRQTNPELHILISPEGIKGQWINDTTHIKYDIELKESYPQGATAFTITGYKDSLQYLKFKEDTPIARSSAMLPEPADKNIQPWFNSLLIENIFTGYSSLTLQQALQKSAKDFFDNYKNEADTLMADRGADSGTHYFLNYEQITRANIIYNDNGFVVMPVMDYSYRGGAHGMYATTMLCFDMQNKKNMKLPDIINIDSATLQSFVEKHFRLQQHIKPGQALDKILFENKLPANNNFYFTSKGLGFYYAPYEVAAYVYGEVDVWIPFTALKPYLNTEFIKRMNL